MFSVVIPPGLRREMGVSILVCSPASIFSFRLFALILSCGFLVGHGGLSRVVAAQEVTELPNRGSFGRLAEPKLAESLQLTDEQRTQIATLITQRAEALGKAAVADRPKILVDSESLLAAVLTDEQRVLFAKVTAEPRLRFNFRFQRWSDVLEWLAKQSDLSLVLDAPPPGTFNYSDTKEYTPVEAQDLLNGVLSTKGYTLIRRGRMLLVIDVQEGIPEGLIPRIPLEELDKRGKFELVSVMFPLAGREPQGVKAEITPLLGPFGKSVLLAQTKQLLVTDTAGIMRAVSAVISSIPEPVTAKVPAPVAVPEVAVYSVKAADAKVAEEVLVKMFPAAKIVADLKAEQVNAFATPIEQLAIKGVIEQMQAHNPPEKKPLLEVYPVRDLDPTQLLANLTLVAPTARLTFDTRQRQIVAFGTPTDQANIKASMEKLVVSGGAIERQRQLEIYRITKADPATTLTLLQGLLPQAKLSLDTQTRRIVALASAEDHQAMNAILEQLQAPDLGPDSATLEFYPLEQPVAPTSIALLMTLAPKAKIVVDAEAKRLQVLATPAEQALIKASLDEILKGLPAPEKRRLVIYRVTPGQRARFQTVLPALATDFPDIRVVPEGEPHELSIWAKPTQHELLKSLIETFVNDVPDDDKPQLISHPLRAADSTTASTVLKTLVPTAKISLDATNKNLVAIASAADHKVITETIEKLQPGELGPDAPVLRFYPLNQPIPATSIAAFAKLVPKATVTADVDGKWLQVVATVADHTLIKTQLEELLQGLPVAEKRKLIVYPVSSAQRTRFQTILPSFTLDFPDVRVIPGTELNELAIWAKPSQHDLVKALVDSLVSDVPEASRPLLVSHSLRNADSTTTTTILKTLVPDAKVSLDVTNKNLVAIATAEDQKVITATIEKLQPGELGVDTPVLRFYPLEQPLPATSVAAFAKLVPKATVTADVDGQWLQVVATVADHALIKSRLEDLLKGLPAIEKRKLTVYPVTPAQRVRFQTVLPSLKTDLPDIRVITEGDPNELAIWAKPSQHELLKGIFDELIREVPVTEKYQLISYPLKGADATTASTVLQTLFPGTKINVDVTTNRLLIWTRPTEHAAIKEALQELDSDDAGERQDKVMVYPVPEIDLDVAIGLLQSILPKVRVMKDIKARTIVAWARKGDQETIARTLASMRSSADRSGMAHLKIYPPGKVNAASMLEVLRVTLPGARIAVDPKTGGIAALGNTLEHEQIQSAITQLSSQSVGQTAQLVTYSLAKTGATTAIPILTLAVPEAKLSVGQDASQLVVWARPEDQVVVEKIVEELESDAVVKKKFELRAYTLKATGAVAAIPLLNKAVPKALFNVGGNPNRLIAWASPVDHEVVAQVIRQLDAEHAPDTTVEFFDIQNVDADAALKLVQAILQKEGLGTTVSLIQGTNQLYVEAHPEQHELIRDALKRLRSTAESGFEVFQLETVDPYAAEALIRRMFGGSSRATAPVVEVDATLQKLYIRGTKEQLVRVRDLLEKMGETELAPKTADGPGKKVRVIPFGGDTASVLTEIQKIWPKLRSNELQILPQTELKSNLLKPRSAVNPPATPVTTPAATPQTSKDASKTKAPAAKPASPLSEEEEDADDDEDFSDEALTEADDAGGDEPDFERPVSAKGTNEPKTTEATTSGTNSSPVVVMPRDGNITIFSDDTEALDQLDKLLRAVSGPKQTSGRGFAVFALKYAGAVSVAETVRQTLKSTAGSSSSRTEKSGPTVVPDERLNAIVVYGSRTDRAAIESLLEALDSSEIPDSKVSNRPKRVAVKNTSAAQIEQVLRLVYKTQLTTGGGRKELPIPSGLAPEIAATLQQMNAMNSGPLLALSVDDVTNSIVVMAPAALAEQVTTLIGEMDEASLTENAKGMKIIPLEHMNSTRTQKVLNLILEKSRKRDRRP
jgi:type II secretory pathway component GspD/PulD (secretin)